MTDSTKPDLVALPVRVMGAQTEPDALAEEFAHSKYASSAARNVALLEEIARLRSALASPQPAPAAGEVVPNAKQPSGDEVDLLLHQVFELCEATEEAPEVEPKNDHQRGFEKGRRFEAKSIRRAIGGWFQSEFCGRVHMGEPLLAPKTAKSEAPIPEPVMRAIREAGLWPIKTQEGYSLVRFATSIAAPSQPAVQVAQPCGGCGETDGEKRCIGCLHPFSAPEPTSMRERWNIERDGNDLLVCFNAHDKSDRCEYQRFVPAAVQVEQPVGQMPDDLRKPLELAAEALHDLIAAAKRAKVELDAAIPAGEPVHPVSRRLTWPLSSALLAEKEARHTLAAHPPGTPEQVPAAWRYRIHTDDSLAGRPNVRKWVLTEVEPENPNNWMEVQALGPITASPSAQPVNEREALLGELLRRARPYVEDGAKRYYDGTDGASIRQNAKSLLDQIDRAALSQRGTA